MATTFYAPHKHIDLLRITQGIGEDVEDCNTGEEILEAANLDWGVELTRNYHRTSQDSPWKKTLDSKVIYRTDNNQQLATVGNRYIPISNLKVASVLDGISKVGDVEFISAGEFNCGRRIWFVARLNEELSMPSGDPVVPYLMVCSSHDGSLSLTTEALPIRARSEAIFNARLGDEPRVYAFRHTKNWESRWKQETSMALSAMGHYFQEFQEVCFSLAGKEMNPVDAGNFLESIIPDPADGNPSRAEDKRANILSLFKGRGEGLQDPGIRGTRYAMAGAITEYADKNQTVRRTKKADGTQRTEAEARARSTLFTGGQRFKKDSLQALVGWS